MKRFISALVALSMLPLSTLAAEQVNKTLDVSTMPTVHIEIIRGNIDIETWNKPQVKVTGTLDEKSEGLLFERNEDSIRIKDKLPRRLNDSNAKGSNLVIMVPRKVNLDADGVSTDFQLGKLEGDIDVETVSGNVNATQINGASTLSSVSGNINAANLSGKIKFSAISGTIKDTNSNGRVRYTLVSGNLVSTSNAEDIEAELISGELEAQFSKVKQLEVRVVSGDAQIKLPGDIERVRAESVSGDIELSFSKKPSASFEFDGGPGGDISNRLTHDKPKKQKYTRAESLSFSTGKASASVKMSTISGELTVRTR
ncbi:DUF4097 family beta strand repeat protein [Shewanella sp. 202IG2-18]|uniref:DUF4097 family beta strand repeat-containing protein n=1 Tax=Parashewanella hymeniacidonis TaxID=2807618 RepID=UPI0019619A6A|nr:DUF4097 family beta strand repeat-containing protein [Parashewanella hymeniacidonis]MBM7072345.1 DUF4097 family beta strand repeat protein [Parashewanella hymeniacidonis]